MRRGLLCLLCLCLLSCRSPAPDTRAVYVLLDRSGVYSEAYDQVLANTRWLLGQLGPGDGLGFAWVDNELFGEKDVLFTVSFSTRPSRMNAQKRQILQLLEQQAEEIRVGSYSDLTGGLLHAVSWLNAQGARRRMILLFSDLPEEPREGYARDFPVDFNQADVVLWQVQPVADSEAPALAEAQTYGERAAALHQKVVSGGGRWQQVSQLEQIKNLFD